MHPGPIDVLQAVRRAQAPEHKPKLLVAGATGTLGNELLRRMVGLQRHEMARVLAREPIRAGMRGVEALVVPPEVPSGWALVPADVGLIMFEPPRLFYDRERALWTPRPDQLPELARWMRACGVSTLAIVLPHAQGRLPEALKRGLASLDEQAVAALGFDRLLIVRSAQKPPSAPARGWLHGLANSMLSIFRFMVPSSEQPVRALKVAQFVAFALQLAPPGIHIAAPELVWQAAQGDLQDTVQRWLAH